LGSRGQATFIVPPATPGLSMGQKFRKHGIRASHTAEVILDDVRVPGRCLVGGKEKLDHRLARIREGGRGGEQAAMKTFEASRPSVAAMAVGVARAATEFATGSASAAASGTAACGGSSREAPEDYGPGRLRARSASSGIRRRGGIRR
jgi:alkylation response protein AidB-like acyl-CoA dehydrogenase